MPNKAKILVVDDEEAALQLLQDALEAGGYDVAVAHDGLEAWELLQKGTVKDIDLLLTDLVMPRMDGMALARNVTKAYANVRILFTSGYADEIVYDHQDLAGVSSFIPKPFDVTKLQRKVREIVGR